MDRRGKFIVFEGLDGSGKTTQIFRMRREMEIYGIKPAIMREPTDGVIGSLVRDALKKRIVFSQETMAHLFAADRVEHINKRLIPELSMGVTCLCDRFVFSNLAFQGVYLPLEQVITYNKYALNTLLPDLTIFIDLHPEVCLRRIHKDRQYNELYEQTDILRKVRKKYAEVFELFPGANIRRVNGDATEDEVFAEIWGHAEKILDTGVRRGAISSANQA